MGTQQLKACNDRVLFLLSRDDREGDAPSRDMSGQRTILFMWAYCLALVCLSVAVIALSGCGSGGYPGGGINGFARGAVTIDAGQSYQVVVQTTSNPVVSWSMAGSSCSGVSCGTLSTTTGDDPIYTAPGGVTTPEVVTLTAMIAGTPTKASMTITVNPDPTLNGIPGAGTVGVAYSAGLNPAGGTAPLTLAVTAGSLPPGLNFNATTGVISGTPTVAGTFTFTAQLTDSSFSPYTVTKLETIVISSATPGPTPLTLTITSLPDGTVNVPYSATIGVAGGTAPYSCSLQVGTLPAGLTLNGCVVSGTPLVAGTVLLTVHATDASNPTEATTGVVSLTIHPAGLTLTVSTLPNGIVGVPYLATIGVTGGTAPYSCVFVSGTLPAGLKANGCIVSGIPTVAGTAMLTVKATDSSNPIETTTGPISITISPLLSTLTITSPPAGTVNVPYTGTIGVTGGTAPYTCVIVGLLPAGLTANNCVITGTPTVAGSVIVAVTATDASNPVVTGAGPVTITINAAAPGNLTLSSPANGTVGTLYVGAIGVSGGTGPYLCTVNSGTLPLGLISASCAITGLPTTAGTSTLNVTATDSSNPKLTVTGNVSLTINPIPKLTLTGSLPDGTVGVAYSQTLTAQGGVAPYTYLITAGSLPPGITMSTSGVVSGTPTAAGASSFTVTATDSELIPQTASLPLVLLIRYPCTTYCAALTGPYAYLFQGYDDVVAGVLAYQTATAASFTADGKGGISAGEMDSNHQSSAATGIVSSVNFLGSYTLGSDYRGSMAITALNADGTTGATTTYAIAVKAPVAPATATTQGSLIESDGNQVVGTKGSGTLLAQTTSAFATGLTGSYAFGMQGDTPCIVSCTANLGAGPVATVGEFATNGAGAITSGIADSNVGTTKTTSAALSGTYSAADGNGRLQLSLATAGTVSTFPTDYAVYMVSANQAFVISTDTHASFILQAGTAQSQTQSTFSNASLNGPFVGYENSYSNPGLLGTTLQSVLNLSTATIFRGVGASNGSCNITNVDTGGTTALLSGLTGILGSTTGLSNLLAASNQTGSTTCTVTASGRGILQYPEPTLLGIPLFTAPAPRVLYLTSPNAGYFLETAYAGLGRFEAQTGAPFSEATTFDGTYVYSTTPASSLASIDNSGTIVSNGSGSATETLDTNVGVGTVNVIQLGNTSTQTYTPPDATTGRFTLGTSGTVVVYAITPNRFVLLDTSALTTSPSVSLLY